MDTANPTVTGIRIDPDGTLTVVELAGADLLHALYGALDCDRIEVAELHDGIDAIFDEEGKLADAEPNDRASMAALLLGFRFLPGDYFAGPVVFLGFNDAGDHISLTPAQRDAIITAST